MANITVRVNGAMHTVDVDPATPLLYVLRNDFDLNGAKYGCGLSQCGACTVLINGVATRSCVTPVSAAVGKRITTIEVIGATPVGKKLQAAWLALDVPQCGYCQSGQIMSASALLAATPKPSDADIDAAMAGNICRCATYVRIRSGSDIAFLFGMLHHIFKNGWEDKKYIEDRVYGCGRILEEF